MPRTCTVCKHPDRARIEALMRSGQSVREVANATGCNKDTLTRHMAHAEWKRVVEAQPEVITPRVNAFPSFIDFCTETLKLTLTRGQRVMARVAFGGENPCDLGDDSPLAVAMFGGVETIPEGARSRVVLRWGRGSGKTTLCVAYGLWRVEYADLSMCGPGDEAVVMVVAPLKIISATDVNMGEAMAKGTHSIAHRVRVANSERITIERTSDHRRASLLVVPKSGGGAAARGKSVIDFIFDESELVQNAEDRAITDTELIRAATPRLIRGGRVFLISTPYPFPSETRQLFKSNYGKPTVATVALATTLQMREDDPECEARFARELAIDPDNARREFLCEEMATSGSFLSPEQVDGAVGPIEATGGCASCGIDLAFVNDSSACIVVERQAGKVVVTRLELLSPAPGKPLVPSEVITQFARLSTQSGAFQALADSWYLESVKEVAIKLGMAVSAGPQHTQFEISALYMRDLFRNRQIVIPPNEQLLDQLKSVMSAPKQGGGVALTFPRRIGAGHADLVPALVYAVWLDRCKYGSIASATFQMPAGRMGGGFQKW